jgi:hypothetical protein
MQVRSADAAAVHPDEDLVRARAWLRNRVDPQLTRAVEDGRLHGGRGHRRAAPVALCPYPLNLLPHSFGSSTFSGVIIFGGVSCSFGSFSPLRTLTRLAIARLPITNGS